MTKAQDLSLYTGRGPRGGWIRLALASPEHDPELHERKYAREFKDAFAGFLASIPQDQRNVLRLHYLDGLAESLLALVQSQLELSLRKHFE